MSMQMITVASGFGKQKMNKKQSRKYSHTLRALNTIQNRLTETQTELRIHKSKTREQFIESFPRLLRPLARHYLLINRNRPAH